MGRALEPQLHEVTGCWSPLSLSGYVTAGTQQADVIHTGPSSWLGCWGCKAMICSQELVMGSGTLQLQNLCFCNYLNHPKQHPNITKWVTRGRYSKKQSEHFQVVRRSSKAIILGGLHQLNLPSIPLAVWSCSPFSSQAVTQFLSGLGILECLKGIKPGRIQLLISRSLYWVYECSFNFLS